MTVSQLLRLNTTATLRGSSILNGNAEKKGRQHTKKRKTTHMYTHIYACVYTYMYVSLSLSTYMYIYKSMYYRIIDVTGSFAENVDRWLFGGNSPSS